MILELATLLIYLERHGPCVPLPRQVEETGELRFIDLSLRGHYDE